MSSTNNNSENHNNGNMSNDSKETRKIEEVIENDIEEESGSKRLKVERDRIAQKEEEEKGSEDDGPSFSSCVALLVNGDQTLLEKRLKSRKNITWGFPDAQLFLPTILPFLRCGDKLKERNADLLLLYICLEHIKHPLPAQKLIGYDNAIRLKESDNSLKLKALLDTFIEDTKTNDEELTIAVLRFWRDRINSLSFPLNTSNKRYNLIFLVLTEKLKSLPSLHFTVNGLNTAQKLLLRVLSGFNTEPITEKNFGNFLALISTQLKDERENFSVLSLRYLKCIDLLCCHGQNVDMPCQLMIEFGFQDLYQSLYGEIKSPLHYKIMATAFCSEIKMVKRGYFQLNPQHEEEMIELAGALLNLNKKFHAEKYFARVFKSALWLNFPSTHFSFFMDLLQNNQNAHCCLRRLSAKMKTWKLTIDDFLQAGGDSVLRRTFLVNIVNINREEKDIADKLEFIDESFSNDEILPVEIIPWIIGLLRFRSTLTRVQAIALLQRFLSVPESMDIYLEEGLPLRLAVVIKDFSSEIDDFRELSQVFSFFNEFARLPRTYIKIKQYCPFAMITATVNKALDFALEEKFLNFFHELMDFLQVFIDDPYTLEFMLKEGVLWKLNSFFFDIPNFKERIQQFFESLIQFRGYFIRPNWIDDKFFTDLLLLARNSILSPLMCEILERFSKKVLTLNVDKKSKNTSELDETDDENGGENKDLDQEVTNTHKMAITTTFKKAYQTQRFADVHFVFDDNTILKAHKVILMSFSEVFDAMFNSGFKESNSENTTTIQLPQMSSKMFSLLLQCIYEGDVHLSSLPTSDIFELVSLSDRYNIKKLTKACDLALTRIVGDSVDDVENILALLDFALQFDLSELRCQCLAWVAMHMVDFGKSKYAKALLFVDNCNMLDREEKETEEEKKKDEEKKKEIGSILSNFENLKSHWSFYSRFCAYMYRVVELCEDFYLIELD